MEGRVDLYGAYRDFESEVLARVRSRTFGEDLGQNSWLLAEEYRGWIEWLELETSSHVLEVGSGSGGPAIELARRCGCRVTGVDINAAGTAAAQERARVDGIANRVAFRQADADAPLPFGDGTFDAVLSIDAINHFADRAVVVGEWNRVLRGGGRILFTDPVVVTGFVSNGELALRSSIGHFVFSPPGANERVLAEAGFELIRREDVTESAAVVSGRWHAAREADRESLVRIEGEDRFDGLQRFFDAVHRLTRERRLSRFVYLARKLD